MSEWPDLPLKSLLPPTFTGDTCTAKAYSHLVGRVRCKEPVGHSGEHHDGAGGRWNGDEA